MNEFLKTYLTVGDAKYSECSEFLHMWACISATASLLERRVSLPFGSSSIIPNLYMMFVGTPGSRKSSAIKLAKKFIKRTGYDTFAADKVTMQKFLCDLGGLNDDGSTAKGSLEDVYLTELGLADIKSHSACYIAQDEFSDFIGINNYGFISLLGNFWDIQEPYKYRLKNGTSFEIPVPTINVLGATTPGQFNTIFPPAIADQGFLSRLLIIKAEDITRKLAFPPQLPNDLDAKIMSNFSKILQLKGEMFFTEEAKELASQQYTTWKGLEDARFATYETRRYSQLLKLCMIMAGMRFSLEITSEDFILANTILSYTETKMGDAIGYYGKADNSDTSHTVLQIIKNTDRPITWKAIYPSVSMHLSKMTDLIQILTNLLAAGKIQQTQEGYLPVIKPLSETPTKFVDYSLLNVFLDR